MNSVRLLTKRPANRLKRPLLVLIGGGKGGDRGLGLRKIAGKLGRRWGHKFFKHTIPCAFGLFVLLHVYQGSIEFLKYEYVNFIRFLYSLDD